MRGGSEEYASPTPAGEEDALAALGASLPRLFSGSALEETLVELAAAAARATRSDVAIVRVAARDTGDLVARAVHAASASVAAELEGSTLDPDDVGIA